MQNKYSFSELVKTVYSLVMTKLSFSQARLIRRPIYIRGKKSIDGGEGLTTGRFCRFDLEGNKKTLHIGKNCQIGDNVHLVALEDVTIGDNVLMASKIFISDTNHGSYKGDNQSNPNTDPKERPLVTAPVKIGNNVWIGENVVILQGVTIGDGCIIGANAVVNKTFEKNQIIVGSPARAVKRYDETSGTWTSIIRKE